MLDTLRIGNFKAFSDTQEIRLRPITLVFGSNSAGKSSIIHSLALAHHALATGELDTTLTGIGGDAIDLGGFRQYVHRRDPERRVEWTVDLKVSELSGRLAELLSSVQTIRLQCLVGVGASTGVALQASTIFADGSPLLSMSARGGGLLRIDRLDQSHPTFRRVLEALIETRTTSQGLRPDDVSAIDAAIDGLVPNITVRSDRFLPRIPRSAQTDRDLASSPLIPVGRGTRHEDLSDAVRLVLPRALRDLVNGLSDLVDAQVGSLSYLGPLRSYPSRHFLLANNHDHNWVAGGGQAWEVVAKRPDVRESVNRWLSDPLRMRTPYQLVVREYVAWHQLDTLLSLSLGPWTEQIKVALDRFREEDSNGSLVGPKMAEYLDSLDIEESAKEFLNIFRMVARDTHPDMVLVDSRTQTSVTHRDVGIGVSQVLPVLVNAYGLSNRLVAIEQPEIHLHPALQAELADVFIESAMGERKNTFLLETHSEHLILRILRRIRETAEGSLPPGRHPIRPGDVSVMYVDTQPGGTRVVPIEVTSDGDFKTSWPDGFFAERAAELM